MKKKWVKRILALGAAAMMLMGSMTAMAAETLMDAEISVATRDYYKELIGNGAPDAATIKITKTVSEGGTSTGTPIKGVEFKILKVGDIAQIKRGNTTEMAYGIKTDLATAINLAADYIYNGYSYVKDYKLINTALQTKKPEDLSSHLASAQAVATGENGVADFGSANEYGLYLAVETSVANAEVKGDTGTWEPISITKKQYPYVFSAPINNPDKTWSAIVNATAKNETGTGDIDKQIVTAYNGPGNMIVTNTQVEPSPNVEALNKTDVTSVGDVVEFKLVSDIIDLKESKDDASVKLSKYIISDSICEGITLPDDFNDTNMKILVHDQSYTIGGDTADCTVVVNKDSTIQGSPITTGSNFEITFNETGLDKLTAQAKSENNYKVWVYYTATVNEKAVVGPTGNLNAVKLKFATEGGNDIDTGWREVKEFIFNMKAMKLFNGEAGDATDINQVKFKLYEDENCTTPLKVTGSDGAYTYSGNVEELTLKNDGTLSIKGVPTGMDLWLKETETAAGFNKLEKPVKVRLEALQTGDTYTGYLNKSETKVNDATVITGDTATEVAFTVNNTSGFRLPTTGGMGATIFAAIGILIVALGGVFYFVSSRKSGKR